MHKKVEFDSTEDNDDNISYSNVMDYDDEVLSEVSIMSYEESLRYAKESEDSNEFEEFEESEEPEVFEESEEPEVFEESEEPEVFEESEEPEVFEPESETYTKFPNDAYKDLMVLVTQHKLNNKAGNAIIKFFNKHSGLSTSPLPKNIEKGRTYINNMKFPNLLFKKICVACHNNQEYFLHYQDLMQCIKNILAVPDITQNLALSYENYEREGESVYKEQNNGMWWKNTETSLPMGAKLLSLILYSDATTTDTLGKSQLHPIYLSIGNIPA